MIPEGFVARTDVLADIPPVELQKFFAGWIKAVAWGSDKANWQEFVKILNAKTFEGDKPFPEDELKEMLASVTIHDKAKQLERNTVGLKEYLEQLQVFLKENGLLKKDFTPAQLLKNEALVEALKK